ncbi:MAG: helix-turn-helix transcriptional regulator, partial [Polyangiaceae bacterium]
MIRIQAVPERSLREKLGEELRTARANAGLSQEGLAKKLDISRPSVASMESGRQSV